MYQIKQIAKNKWDITSPKGQIYIVQEKRSGGLRCSCPGFRFRQDCKHLQMIDYEPPKRIPCEIISRMGRLLMKQVANGHKWAICGSWRRECPNCKDLDIIINGSKNWWLHTALITLKGLAAPDLEYGEHQARGNYVGIPFDITRIDREDEWPFYLLYRTGSKKLNIIMRKKAKDLGLKLNEHGLWRGDWLIPCFDEAMIFEKIGMAYLQPEKRSLL